MNNMAETNAFDGFMNHVAMPVLFAPMLLPMAMAQVSAAASWLQMPRMMCIQIYVRLKLQQRYPASLIKRDPTSGASPCQHRNTHHLVSAHLAHPRV
jgi:hypothetical protein